MTLVDRMLQRWRIAKAWPFIEPGARILDIGSGNGAIFQRLRARGVGGLGIDPVLTTNSLAGGARLVAGSFPKDMPTVEPFEAITLLAVIEHFPPDQYASLRAGCCAFLKPGGLLIVTVPSPRVDAILHWLKLLRLIDGMLLEEHHGYDVRRTEEIFSNPEFELVLHKKFQLGFNNLFVFRRMGRS